MEREKEGDKKRESERERERERERDRERVMMMMAILASPQHDGLQVPKPKKCRMGKLGKRERAERRAVSSSKGSHMTEWKSEEEEEDQGGDSWIAG